MSGVKFVQVRAECGSVGLEGRVGCVEGQAETLTCTCSLVHLSPQTCLLG